MALLISFITQLPSMSDLQDLTTRVTVVMSMLTSQRPIMTLMKDSLIPHQIVTIPTLITSSVQMTLTTIVDIVLILSIHTSFILILIHTTIQPMTTVLVTILTLISTPTVHLATLTMEKNIAIRDIKTDLTSSLAQKTATTPILMMVVTTLTLQAVTPPKDSADVISTQTLTLMIPTPLMMVQLDPLSTTPSIVSDLTTTKLDQTTTITTHQDLTTMVLKITTDMVPHSEICTTVTSISTDKMAVQDPTVSTMDTHTEFYESQKRILELILLIRT